MLAECWLTSRRCHLGSEWDLDLLVVILVVLRHFEVRCGAEAAVGAAPGRVPLLAT